MSKRPPRAMLSIEARPAPSAALFPPAPAGVSTAIARAAVRSLQHLPDQLLAAMVRGLGAHADVLAPGALFRDRDTSGCAVGVTLRELAPDAFQFGRIEFWLWHRWRRGVEPDVARRFPHLQQLQRLFDTAVTQVQAAGRARQPAKTVGMWLAASAGAELRGRQAPARAVRRSATPLTGWNRRRAHRPGRAHLRSGAREHLPSQIRTSS